MAHALDSLGCPTRSGLAFLTSNSPEAFLAKIAAQLLGWRAVGVDRVLAAAEQRHIVADAGASALVCDPTTAEEAKAVVPAGSDLMVLTLGCSPAGPDLLDMARSQPATPIQPRGQPGDVARLFYTGGSTGRSKGCRHTFGTLDNHWAWQPRRWSPRAAAFAKAAQRYLLTSPAGTSVGGDYLALALLSGGTAYLHDRFSAEETLRAVERERITAAFVGTAKLYHVLDHPELASTDTSSLRAITFAGSAITSRRFRQAIDRFGAILHEAYGQTEAGLISVLAPEDLAGAAAEDRLLSAGRPEPGVSISVRDGSGRELPAGRVGTVWTRTGQLMDGYWGLPELTAQTIVHGWLNTGDLGRLDSDGFLHLVDRAKDMVIVRGENCFSHSIEEQLARHPAVRQAAVIGVPSQTNGENVHAAVVTHPGATVAPAELRDLVARTLSPLHAPQTVEFVDELPLTSAGKVDKKALRAPFWAAWERPIH
jgi:fatty-acyl-CoA synthase